MSRRSIDLGKIMVTLAEGVWNARTSYEVLTAVYHDGDGYISRRDNIGVEPGTDDSVWYRIVKQGTIPNITFDEDGNMYADDVLVTTVFADVIERSREAVENVEQWSQVGDTMVEEEIRRRHQEDERIAAENERVLNERNRRTAEENRARNESSRESNESSREIAEVQREVRFEEAMRQAASTMRKGDPGKSAYEVAVEEGYVGTKEQWLASLKGQTGDTPDISIGTVTTAEPGTPAAATIGGTPEAPVLNLTIPKGAVGDTPNFTVGTVSTGEPGTPVVVTITGTAEAPVLNITIPQGLQGNTGSSVEYPFELVNNRTTNDATKALSAAEGKRLGDDIAEVDGLRISNSSSDLDVEDGEGNVIAKFSEGHFKVKNFDSRDISNLRTDTMEDSDLEIVDPNGNVIVRFVDGHIQTKEFDSSKTSPIKKPYQRETYFKTKVDCVQMNASSYDSTDPNSYVSQVIYQDNAVLILPDSYSVSGKPTRLIIFCKQGNRRITEDSNPVFESNNMGNIFHYLVTRGYAVLAADGVPDDLSSALGLDDTRVSGSYVAVQSTKKAYDYVINNYNIDPTGAFVFGYSQGGIFAQNVVDLSGIPIIGCAMVSPTLSMRFHLWDLSSSKTIDGVDWTRTSRLNIARLFGFNEVTTNAELLALQFDKEKVAGYDPWYRNVEEPYEGFIQPSPYGSNLWALPSGTTIDSITMKKRIGCPTKIWMAENDSTLSADIAKVFVKACRNAGQVCDLHLYNAGSHYIYQNSYQSPAISQFSDQGLTYNLFPIAYEIASFFYRLGGLPLLTE